MRWISGMAINGVPQLYEAVEKDKLMFVISKVGSAIYLQDMRNANENNPHFNFDTVENAKIAAKEAVKGKEIISNAKDPFEKLSDLVKDAESFLKSLKKD